MLSIYFLYIFADNIEISTDEFDYLIVVDTIISSKKLIKCNSIKISYSGINIYKLTNIGRKVYFLTDETEYLERVFRGDLRIDYEYKHYGLISEAWMVLSLIVGISIYFLLVVEKPFGIFDI